MRTIRLLIVLCIALIAALSMVPQRQVSSQATVTYSRTITATGLLTVRAELPSPYVIKEFITNLLDSYNVLVKQNDMSRKDFDTIRGYFSLYLEWGSSFNVTLVQTSPYDVNWVTLMFTPIKANQPSVTIDSRDFFIRLFPNASITYGFGYDFQRNFVSTYYNETVVRVYLILELNLSEVSPSSGDYIANANQIGQPIYQYDQSQVPTVSQTQTVTQTSVTSVQVGPNPIDYITSNPWSSAGIGGIIILGVYILMAWSSVKEGVKDLAGVFRRLSRRKKNQDEVKK